MLLLAPIAVLSAALAAEPPPVYRKPAHVIESLSCAQPITDAPPKGKTEEPFWVWCMVDNALHGPFVKASRGGDGKWHIVRTGEYQQGLATGTWQAWRSDGAHEWTIEFRNELQPWQHEIGSSGRRAALTRSVSVSDSTGTEERLCPSRRAMSRPEDHPLTSCRPYGRRVDNRTGEHSFHAPRQQPLQCGAGLQLVISSDEEPVYGVYSEPVTVQPMYCAKGTKRVGPYRGYDPRSGFAKIDVEGAYWNGEATRHWQGSSPERWSAEIEGGKLVKLTGVDGDTMWELSYGQPLWSYTGLSVGGAASAEGQARVDGSVLDGLEIVRAGKWTFWYDSGKKRSEGKYDDGKRVGHWVFYTQRGSREAEGDYVDGKRDGEWTVFDLAGEPRRVVYEDGVSGEDKARDALSVLMPSVEQHILSERRNAEYVPDVELPASLCQPFRDLLGEYGEFAVLLGASKLCQERYPINVDLEDRCRDLAAARCF